MKTVFSRFAASAIISIYGIFVSPISQAAGLNSVLDGMFLNATGPNYVNDQLRGGISGGGVYVRSPVSSIQVMSIDPPRFSLGCGGIDTYLGSFSFITADRLIQFMRNIAQNAAPLAFQMALASASPQLNGMLQKFQAMAQQMNDLNRNSCQLAHGIMDGKANMGEVVNGLTTTISNSVGTAKGWFNDFNASADNASTKSSETQRKAENLKDANGKSAIQELGNITWNALKNREIDGFNFSGIADDTQAAKEIVMSLIGTVIRTAGATDTDKPIVKPYIARTSINELINPPQNPDGSYGVPIWKCADPIDCKSVLPSYYSTTGLRGYVNKKMMGTEDINSSTGSVTGSIVDSLVNCNSASCGLTISQKKFLNAVASVPAIGMLRRAQKLPSLVNAIAPQLVEEMTNEIAIQYAEAVLSLAVTSYSGTATPKPENYDAAIASIKNDLAALRIKKSEHTEKINNIVVQIDFAIRASSKVFTRTR